MSKSDLPAGVEIIDATAIESISRAEVDIQIATAKRYPRSLSRFRKSALEYATVDPETAASCSYYLVKGGKHIEGPSVRLAEICAVTWGNLHTATRIVEEGDRSVVAQSVAWDMETNTRIGWEVSRRIVDRNGKRYNDDVVQTTKAAAAAIAFRNAVFKVIPQVFVEQIRQKCKAVGAGDERSLDDRKRALVGWLNSNGVDLRSVLAWLGREELSDVTLDDLTKLQGIATAVRDQETTLQDVFGSPTPVAGAHRARKPKAAPVKPETEPEDDGVAPWPAGVDDEPPAGPDLTPGAAELLGMIGHAESPEDVHALRRDMIKRRLRGVDRAILEDALAAKLDELEPIPAPAQETLPMREPGEDG